MNLRFPNHFQDRIQDRNINIDHLKKAIREPDSRENVFDGKLKVIKKIGDKHITVIYYKDGFRDRKNDYFVVTAYYSDSK
jgi:hypothetical protein